MITPTHLRAEGFTDQQIIELISVWSRFSVTESGCWKHNRNKSYPAIMYDGQMTLLHRLLHCKVNKVSAEGLIACHICDTPSCIRPSHIVLGTQLDNMRDRKAKKRKFVRTKGRHR